jgi:hypothetical protein
MGKFDKYARSLIDRQSEALLLAVYGGLVAAVERGGGTLVGIGIRFGDEEVLLTLRADFPGGKMVAFVGAEHLPEGFVKATREAGRDQLRWREDKF